MGKYNRGYSAASPFPARESRFYDVLIEKLKKFMYEMRNEKY